MAKLCKAGVQFREQLDDCFPERLRDSDGWVADARHVASGKSDHIPNADGWVFALDIDRDLAGKPKPDLMPYLANQVRIAGKTDKRIKYVIFDKKFASSKTLWRFIPYRGSNPHSKHMHISFTEKGTKDGSFFNIPMLGGK